MDSAAQNFAREILAELRHIKQALHELLRAPGKQNEAGVTPENAADKKSNRTEGKLVAASEIPPSPSDPDKPKKPWYKSLKRWKTILEVVAIPFAIGYAFVTFFQWRDLRSNFTADQRAWVLATGFVLSAEPMVGQSFSVRTRIQNSGKTPAIDFAFQDAVTFGSQPPRCFEWIPNAPTNRGIVPANANDFFVQSGVPFTVTARQFPSYQAKTTFLYFIGMIRYQDVFSKQHWSRFCAFHPYGEPLTQFTFCGVCNDLDH
jgi:hypothetical protein